MEQPLEILVVDDDPNLRGFVKEGLESLGIAVETANDAARAAQILDARPSINLMLLDVMMPGGDGWKFLEKVRSEGNTVPTIFLTARHRVEDRVKGLDIGADDYMIKPFEFNELLARIQAVSRRHGPSTVFTVADLTIDLTRRSVNRGGRDISTTDQEFRLLHSLVKAQGQILSKKFLLKEIWNFDFDPGTNILEVQIARLRRKLDENRPRLIQTVTKKGYRICDPESS